jgi:F-type H+-transporting ATPase subunit b
MAGTEIAICGESLREGPLSMGGADISAVVLAAEESGGGKFLVQPGVGLMIWTLIAFGFTLWFLRRYVFPRIQSELDKRQRAIEETIDTAERTKREADQLLSEYRQRLQEARQQAEDIVARARKAADTHQQEVAQAATQKQQEMLEQARRDIEVETRLALERIRKEVADLTVLATEKVTRKTLTTEDQKRLVQEALAEVDFSALGGDGNGGASTAAREAQ